MFFAFKKRFIVRIESSQKLGFQYFFGSLIPRSYWIFDYCFVELGFPLYFLWFMQLNQLLDSPFLVTKGSFLEKEDPHITHYCKSSFSTQVRQSFVNLENSSHHHFNPSMAAAGYDFDEFNPCFLYVLGSSSEGLLAYGLVEQIYAYALYEAIFSFSLILIWICFEILRQCWSSDLYGPALALEAIFYHGSGPFGVNYGSVFSERNEIFFGL